MTQMKLIFFNFMSLLRGSSSYNLTYRTHVIVQSVRECSQGFTGIPHSVGSKNLKRPMKLHSLKTEVLDNKTQQHSRNLSLCLSLPTSYLSKSLYFFFSSQPLMKTAQSSKTHIALHYVRLLFLLLAFY